MPAERLILAHVSDPHIGAQWAGGDPAGGFTAVAEALRRLPQTPDAVLVTGDLADHGADAEYEQVRQILETIEAPAYVLPGNHDDRRTLRRHFDLPGADDEAVQYAVDFGSARLIVLDTTRPGEDPGALDAARLDWLDRELAAAPTLPTLVAMHHPPIVTGIPGWDETCLPSADRQALGEIVARHPQLRRLVAAHVHRIITSDLAGRTVLTVPSTYVQARPNFVSGEVQATHDPIGFALHTVVAGEWVSQVQLIPNDAEAARGD